MPKVFRCLLVPPGHFSCLSSLPAFSQLASAVFAAPHKTVNGFILYLLWFLAFLLGSHQLSLALAALPISVYLSSLQSMNLDVFSCTACYLP